MKKQKIALIISMITIGSISATQLRDLHEEEKELIKQDNMIDYLNSRNQQRNIDGIGAYVNQAIESNTRVVDSIRNKLDRKYSDEDNYIQSVQRLEENISSTGWIDSSSPYGCTAWTVVSGDERRTCKVTQLRSETRHNRNPEFGLVKDINISFQEREVEIIQYRSQVAPTERFLVDYNRDFAWGGGSGSGNNNNPGDPTGGQNGKTGPVTASLIIPEELYIGYKFPISWSSTNAEFCDISLLSGANNGTEATRREIVLNTEGQREVTLRCGNQTDEALITKTINVEKIQCPELNSSTSNVRGFMLTRNLSGTIIGPTSGFMITLPKSPSGTVETRSSSFNAGWYSCGRYSYRVNGREYWAAASVMSASASYSCIDGEWFESNYRSNCRQTRSNDPYFAMTLTQNRPTSRKLNNKIVPDYSNY